MESVRKEVIEWVRARERESLLLYLAKSDSILFLSTVAR